MDIVQHYDHQTIPKYDDATSHQIAYPNVDLAYLNFNKSAISSNSTKALSKSSLVCPAEIQNLALDMRIGTAGNPTTTTASPRLRHSLEKAAILVGL
mmetsp:Transcript_29741/g.62570  ORF Transcript_29741/g.62570 Transcript_29741/m.62570 type:complete len:97 (+) Transcript_29741:160-450(+)